MGSVVKFAPDSKCITELSSPFREALMDRLSEREDLKHLIFSPSYSTSKFQTLASVFCVTSRRWLIVIFQGDGSTTVAECSYDATLLVELTLILLFGQLKIDFVQDGAAKSIALHFNTVMQHTYSDAIQYILDAIDGPENIATSFGRNRNPTVGSWPLKFRNFAIIYVPKKSLWLDGVCWKEIRASFGRELAPAAAALVTDRHLVVIAEEKISRWFQFRHDAKYGAIITYFPLNRLADFRIHPHPRFCILELEGCDGHGGEKLEIVFPLDEREAVSRVMGKAKPGRLPASPEK
jgi:hypothetical protein